MLSAFLGKFEMLNNYYDDIIYVPLYTSVILVNKYVLSVLNFTIPTVFQGWQTFACVLLLSTLIKFEKIKNDLQVLEKAQILKLLPILMCFAFSIVAGSKALYDVPVPIFVAVTNINPALAILLLDKNSDKSTNSLKVPGCIFICVSVVAIFVLAFIDIYNESYNWLMVHILLNFLQAYLVQTLDFELTDVTYVYYRNFFSVIVLLPISVTIDFELRRHFRTEFYIGCLLSGVLGTFLQLWTFKVDAKKNFINFQCVAKLICSVIAHVELFRNVPPLIWVMIVINLVLGMFAFGERVDPNAKVEIATPALEVEVVEEKKPSTI